jgi:hypothetical protein
MAFFDIAKTVNKCFKNAPPDYNYTKLLIIVGLTIIVGVTALWIKLA